MDAFCPIQVVRSSCGRKPSEADMSLRLVLFCAFLAAGYAR